MMPGLILNKQVECQTSLSFMRVVQLFVLFRLHLGLLVQFTRTFKPKAPIDPLHVGTVLALEVLNDPGNK